MGRAAAAAAAAAAALFGGAGGAAAAARPPRVAAWGASGAAAAAGTLAPGEALAVACAGAPAGDALLLAVAGEGGRAVLPHVPDARCALVARGVAPPSPRDGALGAYASEDAAARAHARAGALGAAPAPLGAGTRLLWEEPLGAALGGRLSAGLRPRQAHVSFGAAPDEATVIWVSSDFIEGAARVEWGHAPGEYPHRANATASTYAAADLCNFPANDTRVDRFIPPGHFHRASLTALRAGATVYYRVGEERNGWSEERSFRARGAAGGDGAAAGGAADEATRFLMYADQALPVPEFAPAWRLVSAVVDDIEAGFDRFLLHPGDLGYAMGSGILWDVYMELIEPIASRVPYMVTVGNHEYDYHGPHPNPSGEPMWAPQDEPGHAGGWGIGTQDSRGECGVPTAARFDGTGNGNGIFWYSFDEGLVHVVMLSSEHDWRPGSAMYAWLQADLAAVDRSATPWVVLNTHRMMYTTQLGEEGDKAVSLAMRAALEPLLLQHRVNLMLVGHQHSYERSCVAARGACAPDGRSGVAHLVVGSAGATAERKGFSPTLGNFSLVHADVYGYLRAEATREKLAVQFVRVDADKPYVYDAAEYLPWPQQELAGAGAALRRAGPARAAPAAASA